jgi:sulfocyanin
MISALGVVLGIVLWIAAYVKLPNDVTHRNLAANPPIESSVSNATATASAGSNSTTGSASTSTTAFYSPGSAPKTLNLNLEGISNDSGMTFNGYNKGALKVTVPVGWTVHVHFVDKDAMPHSVGFVPWNERTGGPFSAAFPGSLMDKFETGIQSSDPPVEFSFTADKAGQYAMVCGVPGHATAGMWDEFDVSATAKAPTITTPSGTVTVK